MRRLQLALVAIVGLPGIALLAHGNIAVLGILYVVLLGVAVLIPQHRHPPDDGRRDY